MQGVLKNPDKMRAIVIGVLKCGNSITNQKAILKKYAEDNGFSNHMFYVDDGVSGTTFEREGFKSMMTDVEAGKVGIVITKDLSRTLAQLIISEQSC